MTTVRIFLRQAPKWRGILDQLATSMVLAGFTAAATTFYYYACLSITRLQHLSPEQFLRALTGL